MAFVPANLRLTEGVPGRARYRYDTTDGLTTVDGDGYFNNLDDAQNLAVGDLVDVVVWSSAVYTGTISAVGLVVVLSVNATTGVIDMSNDLLGATLIDSD